MSSATLLAPAGLHMACLIRLTCPFPSLAGLGKETWGCQHDGSSSHWCRQQDAQNCNGQHLQNTYPGINFSELDHRGHNIISDWKYVNHSTQPYIYLKFCFNYISIYLLHFSTTNHLFALSCSKLTCMFLINSFTLSTLATSMNSIYRFTPLCPSLTCSPSLSSSGPALVFLA